VYSLWIGASHEFAAAIDRSAVRAPLTEHHNGSRDLADAPLSDTSQA
jgi:hypothetical protein